MNKVMDEIFAQAKKEHKMIRCRSLDCLFTADELAIEQENGQYRWYHKDNWTLVDPKDHLLKLMHDVARAQEAVSDFTEKIRNI